MHWLGKQKSYRMSAMPWSAWHGMAWHVRTELLRVCHRVSSALNPQDEFSVNIYEEVVRFHLLSEHELCEEEASSEHTLPVQLHSCCPNSSVQCRIWLRCLHG